MNELEIPAIGDKKWHQVWGWVEVTAVRTWPVIYTECLTDDGSAVSGLLSQLWDEEW